jgi:hypothetical protein
MWVSTVECHCTFVGSTVMCMAPRYSSARLHNHRRSSGVTSFGRNSTGQVSGFGSDRIVPWHSSPGDIT